ncbi:branchpoint-bridging protein-like [Acropora millepora]|uniref:branchpoint-bridging protein-like n=1 Tax=Acropora millepora TaxID=45264 RepID=UPI001CF26B46|nr:branchpoint-bridging protein-like [Acropora millepora]
MCHKCNRYGHFARECPNVVCFNCDNLGHISKECPDSRRCCICKFLNHLAINSASGAVVLVHVPDPVKPQQSEPLWSSQPATLPSSSAPSSSGVASSTYSHVLQSSLPFWTESWTPPSASSSSASSTRINRARSDSLVDPLRRVANVPVLLCPSKALSPRRTSPVDGSPTVSKRSKPSKTYSSRSR